MNFLEELENDQQTKKAEKTPRQLWESSFKYFKHFVTILKKNDDEFDSTFNLVSLDLISQVCKIIGPYEISRMQNETALFFEVKLNTQLNKKIKIHRKDKRSAELLTIKLNKEGILSTITNIAGGAYTVELNSNIASTFKFILENNTNFYIEYRNILISNRRLIKLPVESINQNLMDKIAKYILGKNPDLYKESISNKEISKIRNKVNQDRLRKKVTEKRIQNEIKQQEELEKIRKSNTLKAKSKKYLSHKSHKLKDKFLNKLSRFKK
ncbi:MAG: hypothetical protein L3J53_02655 [Proteobacteria bacterium]|nr:hypothetical protein [Pseudomonadota bacterium]